MNAFKLLKYRLASLEMLCFIFAMCVVIPLIILGSARSEYTYRTNDFKKYIDEHGAQSADSYVMEDDSFLPLEFMIFGGMTGGSAAIFAEFFGTAMQCGVSRKSSRRGFLMYMAVLSLMFASSCAAAQILSMEHYSGLCENFSYGGAVVNIDYPTVDNGFLLWLKYFGIGMGGSVFGALMYMLICKLSGIKLGFLILSATVISITSVIVLTELLDGFSGYPQFAAVGAMLVLAVVIGFYLLSRKISLDWRKSLFG